MEDDRREAGDRAIGVAGAHLLRLLPDDALAVIELERVADRSQRGGEESLCIESQQGEREEHRRDHQKPAAISLPGRRRNRSMVHEVGS